MDKKEDGPGSQCGHTLTAVPLSAGSFLVSFSFHTANAEEDDSKVQAFLAEMESSIRDPSLRANATDQEIDHALEGLEKYVMTKLFDRTFGTSTEDAISDMDISEKIGLLQQFVKPHHSDIPKVLHNEPSWLVTHSELEASTMRFQSLMLAISSKDGSNWQYNFGECELCFCLSASVAISDLNHTLLQGSANVGKSVFISAMLRTMAYKELVAAAAQKYKPIQSDVPRTTLGPIQIEAYLGKGV
ncbi:Vacuolar protein sorting-associated protein 9A [Zea mays]|uniref:Vacuolar protein sorting-associated protein 9A n=1 Tax=Zea mays TaxID=4577 RepID=A0A1D6EE75_MAIZE|nr:Vacuolar protein sorting-associated protein 9A [Zea mays]